MSDPARVELATAALWARLYTLFDIEGPEPIKRPAAHWIEQWAPHWSWPWDQVVSVEIFEARLMRALQAREGAANAPLG